MKEIRIEYLELTEPKNFYKNWSNDKFINWITRPGSSLLYLQTILANLENNEMYEFCKIVKEVIYTTYETH